ncbi:hypothetical protein LSUCC0031_14400 [Rhodobacterales bacterium LSUCC0031]|nr:hypothetical protein [Rhodobacterales bacterium LSUCC0031]
MQRMVLLLIVVATLTGCGTARGVGHGVGEIFDGMGDDFRSLGDLFER